MSEKFAESLMGEGGVLGDHLSAAIAGMSDAEQVKFHAAIGKAQGVKVQKAQKKSHSQ